jgi:hypothetical protein
VTFATVPTFRRGAPIDRRFLRHIGIVAAVFLVTSCGRVTQDAEGEIAALVETAADAAETGDAAALQAMISPAYEDGEGRDRRAIGFVVKTWLGRYPNLLVVISDLRVEPVTTQLATARMSVTLLGRDGRRPLLSGVDADRMYLRLALRRESGDWRITRADWERQGADYLGPPN